MQVIHSLKSRKMVLPVYGGSADIFQGALMMPGVTAATNDGVLIKNSTTSNADAIGVLNELHDYSLSGDALVDGTVPWFFKDTVNGRHFLPSREIQLPDAATLVRVDYDLTSGVAIDGGYATVRYTITNLEDNIDTAFFYIRSGTGIGQTSFIVASGSGTADAYSALGTSPASTDEIVKIHPLFHDVVVWTAPSATAETKLGTTAAVGTGRALILSRHIVRDGLDQDLDPVAHHNLTGLDHLAQLGFYNLVQIQDTGFHPLD